MQTGNAVGVVMGAFDTLASWKMTGLPAALSKVCFLLLGAARTMDLS
jgi:hypothetical protein